jgi:NADH-quinone oxidoreductase subunit G
VPREGAYDLVLKAAGGEAGPLLAKAREPGDGHRRTVDAFRTRERRALWLGLGAQRSGSLGEIQVLATALAGALGATLGFITEGPNAAGLALAGALPHRGTGGQRRPRPGARADALLAAPPAALLTFGVEPEGDCAAGAANLRQAAFAVAVTSFFTPQMREWAHVALPLAAFAENDGTYVNCAGTWQTFSAAARAVGEARPGWKILRVLGNRLGLAGFEQADAAAVREELRAALAAMAGVTAAPAEVLVSLPPSAAQDAADPGMYRIDALVRRAAPLQATRDGRGAAAPLQRTA